MNPSTAQAALSVCAKFNAGETGMRRNFDYDSASDNEITAATAVTTRKRP